MSLHLGRIHYWLYNKISWFEDIEQEMVGWAKEQKLPADEWIKEIYAEFGMPTGNRPLEEIIDASNIHGWLQGKIQSAELRQAALVTRILAESPEYKGHLLQLFAQQGENAAKNYEGETKTPEAIYNAMNDFILEGMPCDRVNEILKSEEDEFVWQTTVCLHRPFWQKIEGDVENFYNLREAWIQAFVEASNPSYEYIRGEQGINRIIRK